jgi:hypothetical protein
VGGVRAGAIGGGGSCRPWLERKESKIVSIIALGFMPKQRKACEREARCHRDPCIQ